MNRIMPVENEKDLAPILDEVSSILNNTPVALLLVDSERKVRRVNRAVIDMTGKQEEDVIGLRGGEALGCVHALDDPAGCGSGPECETCCIKDAVLRTFETGERHNNIETHMAFENDGSTEEKDLLVSTARIERSEGDLVLVCVEDITERKRLAKRLQNTERMELLGQLASGVAHEVRNPLNSILAVSDALNEDLKDNEEYAEYLEQIHVQVDRLSHLMQDLLDLGKPLQISSLEPVSLGDICRSALKLWEQSLPDGNVSVEVKENDSAEVSADPARLQQVFLNLVENAAEHSPDKGRVIVDVSAPDSTSAVVRVCDRGSGISPEELTSVFRPFYTTRKKGTGLGLSIVKHIVESHNGTVSIYNNDPPPGCTVEVRLPRKETS